MKSINYISFLILSALLFSCTPRSTKSPENNITFDSLTVNLKPHFFNDDAKPSYEIQLNFTYPTSGLNPETLAAVQRIFIETTLDKNLGDLSPEAAVKAWTNNAMDFVKSLEDDYREATAMHRHEDGDEDRYFTGANEDMYEIRSNEIIFNKNNILSFGITEDSYLGGAHGSVTYTCRNIDLTAGALFNEKDIFTEGYQSTLASIIIAKITKQSGLSNPAELEDAGFFSVDEIVPNDNFSIGEKGLKYYYNPYEIAAYAIGLIEVFIPYEELSRLLREDSPLSILAR